MKKKTIAIWSHVSFGVFILCVAAIVAFSAFELETIRAFRWVIVLLGILLIASVVFSIVLKRIKAKRF
ncbi:MAG: hypothetical protein GX663_01440 [Clostridiales bacterium]|nr:hypothetical protein [Clostridiales bacterium]